MCTCKISARLHSLTEMSPDRNISERNGPDRNGSDRIGQTEKSRTHCCPHKPNQSKSDCKKRGIFTCRTCYRLWDYLWECYIGKKATGNILKRVVDLIQARSRQAFLWLSKNLNLDA